MKFPIFLGVWKEISFIPINIRTQSLVLKNFNRNQGFIYDFLEAGIFFMNFLVLKFFLKNFFYGWLIIFFELMKSQKTNLGNKKFSAPQISFHRDIEGGIILKVWQNYIYLSHKVKPNGSVAISLYAKAILIL